MSDNSIEIIVEINGWHDGQLYTQHIRMEAVPEESLVSIVDRVKTDLDDFGVKRIDFI